MIHTSAPPPPNTPSTHRQIALALALSALIGALVLTVAAAAPAATRDLTKEALAACRSEEAASAVCNPLLLGIADVSTPTVQPAADPWKGAGGDPWGLHGTPRLVLGEPIVGEYAYIGSDGERHGVVRVRQHSDFSYRGVAMKDWDPISSTRGALFRSDSCDIPAGETMWWDINPRWDMQDTWTFDNRNYFAWANYRTATTYSGDPDGVSRVECRWSYGPTTAELMLGVDRPLLVWPYPEPLTWRKLDHGGPVVKARNGSGTPGRKFSISFTADEPDGWASFYVQIYRRKDLVAGVIYEVEVPIGMSTDFKARGNLGEDEVSQLRWCVTAYDAARNKRSDCAKLVTPCDRATKQLKRAKKDVSKARRELRRAAPGDIGRASRRLKKARKVQKKSSRRKKKACSS